MRRELTISEERIDEQALSQGRTMSRGMGAAVCFLGVVRGTEEERPILALDYEAFKPMAEHQFQLLFDQAEKRWLLESVRLVHRLGRVPGRGDFAMDRSGCTAPGRGFCGLPIHRLGNETGCPHLEEGIPTCLSDEQTRR